MLQTIREARLKWIYGLMFLFALALALLAYIHSSFLKTFIPLEFVGIVYTVGYSLTFFALGDIRYVITLLNPRKSIRLLLCIAFTALVGLAFIRDMWFVMTLFIIYMMTIHLLVVNLDVIIEHYTQDKETGRIRGMVLTFGNFAFVLAPVFAGSLLDQFDFWVLYFLAACILIPVYISFRINFKDMDVFYKTTKVKQVDETESLSKLRKNKSLQLIFGTAIALNIFYSVMVIYVPLYLLSIGFSWTQIGLTLTIALLPFVLIQYLVGWLADRYFGEQEMLIIGFLIIGLATMALFFIQSLVAWIIVLFITRIGAALIEVLTETYFYKKVQSRDVILISFFRRTSPLGHAIGPLVASALLQFLSLRAIFLFLGFLLLWGVFLPFHLKDTK